MSSINNFFDCLLFLDIDGVLNSDNYFNSKIYKLETYGMSDREIRLDKPESHLDFAAIKIVNKIVALSHCTVILSSSWRTIFSLEEINKMLQIKGANFNLSDQTPKFDFYDQNITRGIEIESYLNSSKNKTDSFVILDDVDNMGRLTDHLYLINEKFGLRSEDISSILERFKIC